MQNPFINAMQLNYIGHKSVALKKQRQFNTCMKGTIVTLITCILLIKFMDMYQLHGNISGGKSIRIFGAKIQITRNNPDMFSIFIFFAFPAGKVWMGLGFGKLDFEGKKGKT